ncbi:long-chain-fatty-acid--CoA ligase 1 [Nephila pilipes]|uniref:long-chain-fatty-acid--CoA ligase n=1 Tax=Nephila pilipes TaxID=299642 RepID=A0A8X6NTN9_NEPPI|nr:long-chain-fatty-acid--CoA ligase 1 [Nephila pilipes]
MFRRCTPDIVAAEVSGCVLEKMWCKSVPCLVDCFLQQMNVHHAKHFFKATQRVNAVWENSSKTSELEMTAEHPRKQIVLKKTESIQHGRKKIKIYPPPARMLSQSVVLPGPERIRASGASNNPEQYFQFLDDKTHTVCDTVVTGLHKSTSGECLGLRSPLQTGKYKWINYSEVSERKDYIGSGLLKLGIHHSQEAMVGICTRTRPEFVLVMLACSRYSMVLVPLYHCFGSENMTYIIDQVKMEALFCEDSKFAMEILESKKLYPALKHIVLIDANEEEIAELSASYPEMNIISLKDLEISGKLNLQKPEKPKPDDLFCICYTSGTTGIPKGVKVTHRNILSCIASLDAVLGESIPKRGSLMCYLPCAHIYEIINEVYCLFHGCQLGFYSGSTDTLLGDIAELKPVVLPLVPKLMNLIYSGVKKKIGQNRLRRYLLHLSLQQKERTLQKGIVSKTAIWDKLVFSKIQKTLGDSIQLIFTASAPVSREVMQFFRCSMGCLVFEVYGLSEVGAAAMTLMSEHDSGFVGPPLPCNHIKLVSVPEMSYVAEKDEGEICIKGANVFSGYFNNEEATVEAIDANGWYHTGDIGKWLPNGALKIIDRKKHIFKLAQGEYIFPDKIENTYLESHIISQIYVDGNSDQEFLVGVIVPDTKAFLSWAQEEGFTGDLETLCQNKELKKALLNMLQKVGKERHLTSIQQVGNIYLTTEPFSQENGLLTPTMKLKRTGARKKFEQVFQKLYEEGNLCSKNQ